VDGDVGSVVGGDVGGLVGPLVGGDGVIVSGSGSSAKGRCVGGLV
jgi:hypothetical protein